MAMVVGFQGDGLLPFGDGFFELAPAHQECGQLRVRACDLGGELD